MRSKALIRMRHCQLIRRSWNRVGTAHCPYPRFPVFFLSRDCFCTLAATMVQVDELFGLSDVAHDVELPNWLLLRRGKRCVGKFEAFAFVGIFGPQAGGCEVFQSLRVFN